MVLSADFRQDTVAGAVQAGAAGFIPKTVSGALLVDALRQVLAGEMYRPESMMAEEDYDDYAVSPEPPCAPSPLDGLSDRERTLLALVVEGLTNKEIGRRVGLQEATIKAHLRVLYRRIGAINRAQAVRIALQS